MGMYNILRLTWAFMVAKYTIKFFNAILYYFGGNMDCFLSTNKVGSGFSKFISNARDRTINLPYLPENFYRL